MTVQELKSAGQVLGLQLLARGHARSHVLAIPRRGAIVGRAAAIELLAPMDLVLATKVVIGEDGFERRIGAVALPDVRVEAPGAGVLPRGDIDASLAAALTDLRRRLPILRGDAPLPDVADRTVIVIDDAAITGETMQAAIAAVRLRAPARVVAAVARGTSVALDRLHRLADDLVVLETIPFQGAAEAHEAAAGLIAPPLDDREIYTMARLTQKAAGFMPGDHLELDGIEAYEA